MANHNEKAEISVLEADLYGGDPEHEEMTKPSFDGFELFLTPDDPAKIQVFNHQGETSRYLNVSGELNTMMDRPSASADEVVERQSIIDDLLTNPEECALLVEVERRLGSCLRAATILTTPSHDRWFGGRSAPNVYPTDEILQSFGSLDAAVQSPRSKLYEQDSDTVKKVEALRTILHAPQIINRAAELLEDASHPFFNRLQEKLTELGAACTPDFVHDTLVRDDEGHVDVNKFATWSNRIANFAGNAKALQEFAELVKTHDFKKVSYDSHQPASYTDGANPVKLLELNRGYSRWGERREPKPLVRNKAVPEEDLVVLSGSNMSGKSFLLEQTFYLQLLAQTFGYAPAESYNARIYKTVGVVDRASTDAANDLSALGAELVAWQNVLDSIGPNSLVLADESFSTTAPEDQHDLLVGITSYLKEMGAKVVLSSHNEQFIQEMSAQPDVALAHLAVRVGDDGDIEFLHKLTDGSDESHAFEVGRLLGLPDEIIAVAESYLQGEAISFTGSEMGSRPIATYTEAEREEQKTLQLPLYGLLDREEGSEGYVPPVFYNISGDHELRGLYQEGGLPGWKRLIDAASTDSREILERQKLFSELMDPETWQKIAQASNRVMNLLNAIRYGDMVDTLIMPLDFVRWTRWKEHYGHQKLPDVQSKLGLFNIAIGFELSVSGLTPKEAGIRKYVKWSEAVAEAVLSITTEIDDDDHEALIEQALADILPQIKEHFELARDTSWSATLTKLSKAIYEKVGNRKHNKLGYYLSREIYSSDSRDFKDMPGVKKRGDDDEDSVFSRYIIPPLEERAVLAAAAMGPSMHEAHQRYLMMKGDIDETQLIEGINEGRFGGGYGPLFELWEYMLGTSDPIGDLVQALRETDSVHLHQVANHLEVTLNQALPKGGGYGILYPLIKDSYGDTRIADRFGWDWRLQKATKNLSPITTILAQTATMRSEGYKPAQFTSEPAISITNGWSPVKNKAEHVPNSLTISAHNPTQFLTGANMSGKTSHLKQALLTQLCAQATGYVPAEAATLPVLDSVVYLDRVQHYVDHDLSAFGNEVKHWGQLIERVAKSERSLVAVDEPFSTTSPRYQEALTFAAMRFIQMRKALGMFATHNHTLVDKYMEVDPTAQAFHLGVSFDNSTGEIDFDYTLQPGHAPSRALAVARVVNGGLPEKVLQYAGMAASIRTARA